MVNCAGLAINHTKGRSKYKAWMSVERFPFSFGLTGAEADPCPCFPILPLSLDPESSVLILNTPDCCWFSYFLSTFFFPIFASAEVPNFLNFVLKTWRPISCTMILMQQTHPTPALISNLVLSSLGSRCLSQSHLTIASNNCYIQSLVEAKQQVLSLWAQFTYLWQFLTISLVFWCPGCFVANDKQFHGRSAFVFTPPCTNLSLEDWAPFSALTCWFTIWNVVSILCHY